RRFQSRSVQGRRGIGVAPPIAVGGGRVQVAELGRGPNARRSGSQTHHARGHDGGPRDPISPTQRNLPRRFLSRVPHPGPGRRFAMTFTSARDGWLLFGTRFVRMFAYGFLSVALVLYLKAVGLAEGRIG